MECKSPDICKSGKRSMENNCMKINDKIKIQKGRMVNKNIMGTTK